MYLGTEEIQQRSYAEATQRVIDEEVAALLREAEHRAFALLGEHRAFALLGEHRDALDRLLGDLLAHETVDADAVQAAIDDKRGPVAPPESGGPMPQVQYQAKGSARNGDDGAARDSCPS
jgi:cell division protease FtsH